MLVAVIEEELNRMNAEWTQAGNVREYGRSLSTHNIEIKFPEVHWLTFLIRRLDTIPSFWRPWSWQSRILCVC